MYEQIKLDMNWSNRLNRIDQITNQIRYELE